MEIGGSFLRLGARLELVDFEARCDWFRRIADHGTGVFNWHVKAFRYREFSYVRLARRSICVQVERVICESLQAPFWRGTAQCNIS